MPIASRVSVIIPTYQSADTLPRAVSSTLHQTYRDLEILIVDDGSTDNTHEVVKRLRAQDSRVHYIYQDNSGPASARNNGIGRATGSLVAFLDADDEWHQEKIRDQVAVMDSEPSASLVFTDSHNINSVDRLSARYSELYRRELKALHMVPLDGRPQAYAISNDGLRRTLYKRDFIHTSSVMIRGEVLQQRGSFDTRCMGTEDLDLWLRLADTERFVYIDRVLATRHKNSRSLSFRSEAWLLEQIRFHSSILDSTRDNDLHDLAVEQLSASYRQLLKLYGRTQSRMKALQTVARSCRIKFDVLTLLYAVAALLGPAPFIVGGRLSRTWKSTVRSAVRTRSQ